MPSGFDLRLFVNDPGVEIPIERCLSDNRLPLEERVLQLERRCIFRITFIPTGGCVGDFRDIKTHAVTSLRLGAPHGTELRRWTEHQAGVTLGIGLGMSELDDPKGDGFLRIGHMGHVNAHMVLGGLASIQAGFDALALPYGRGALDKAAKVLSS